MGTRGAFDNDTVVTIVFTSVGAFSRGFKV